MGKRPKKAKAATVTVAGASDKSEPADAVEATVVVGTYDGALLGIRASDGVQVFGFAPHTGCVKAISTDVQGRLASGGTDHAVRLFDLARGVEMGEIQEHDDTVSCLEHWGTTTLMSASEDGQVCIWSTNAWDMLKKFRAHKSAITCIAVHPSGRMMASAARDKSVRLWDLTRASSAANLSTDDPVEVMNWSPSGDLLAALTPKELLVVTASSGSVAKFKDPSSSGFMRVSLFAVVMVRDDVVVLGDGTGALRVFTVGADASGLSLACSLPHPKEAPRSRVKALVRPTDGGGRGIEGIFIAGMSSGRVEVWQHFGPGGDASVDTFSLLRAIETDARLTSLGCWGSLSDSAMLAAAGAASGPTGVADTAGEEEVGEAVQDRKAVEKKRKRNRVA